jgi:low affinity Fe/Cu permease
MGDHGAYIPLQRYMAARDQYWNNHRFLMVFLIQATQNRDTLALQIKLSELILALEGARNELAAVEKQPEQALQNIAEQIHEQATSSEEGANRTTT